MSDTAVAGAGAAAAPGVTAVVEIDDACEPPGIESVTFWYNGVIHFRIAIDGQFSRVTAENWRALIGASPQVLKIPHGHRGNYYTITPFGPNLVFGNVGVSDTASFDKFVWMAIPIELCRAAVEHVAAETERLAALAPTRPDDD